MKLSSRLLMAILVSLFAMLLLVVMAVSFEKMADRRLDDALNNLLPSVNDLNGAVDAFVEMRIDANKTLLVNSADERKKLQQLFQASSVRLKKSLDQYQKNDIYDEEDKELLIKDKKVFDQYEKTTLAALALEDTESGRVLAIPHFLHGDVKNAAEAFLHAIREHVAYNMKIAEVIQREDQSASTRDVLVLSSVAIISFFLLIVVYLNVYRAIVGGLAEMKSVIYLLNRDKNLTMRHVRKGRDEVCDVLDSVNALIENLHQDFGKMEASARAVMDSSKDFSQSAREVAQASSQQSEASASMATSIEQMTVAVNHIAERTAYARTLAQEAGQLANQGSATITQTIQDIREISQAVEKSGVSIRELENHSSTVNAVVLVIKDIADQTNLLALNAAIEAARAGELGRGFAVVADEVRKLAERTSVSTQEIAQTIHAMREKSSQATEQMKVAEELARLGVSRADDADQAINKIGDATVSTVKMVEEMAISIAEQGQSANSIAGRIEQVVQMAEASSVSAADAARNAGQLLTLAERQIGIIQQYTL
ncbi:methyl-accepting chemotaxis protein [Aquitalea sp. LB_tupeE]|uniref:methyl-accepting chemotaxis protein n=1 Tax=Aquitalea sp. LB_tupeE TaxID=2748078 RepID=UPI0015C1781A|nr:methyl-accepting chemotaxis protein [Aquitalea sp. LB_tupeE]NWK80273.1 methyl-accepting chemotaxis protein [Aquitalea sp. LB_tupeE]